MLSKILYSCPLYIKSGLPSCTPPGCINDGTFCCCSSLSSIPYGGLFSKGFIFGYFKEAFLCKNKFLGPTILRKYIPTINNEMLVCTHVIPSLQCKCDFSPLMLLYRYFNPARSRRPIIHKTGLSFYKGH